MTNLSDPLMQLVVACLILYAVSRLRWLAQVSKYEDVGTGASVIALVLALILLFIPIESLPFELKIFVVAITIVSLIIILIHRTKSAKPRFEITTSREGNRLGFNFIIRKKALQNPEITYNETEYKIEKNGSILAPEQPMLVDTNYQIFPYKIVVSNQKAQDNIIDASLVDIGTNEIISFSTISMGEGTTGTFEDTTNMRTLPVTFSINALHFSAKVYRYLDMNISGLQVSRSYSMNPVPPENITFKLRIRKEPNKAE